MAGRDLLALGRVEILQIGLGHRPRPLLVDVLVDDRDRRFGEDAERRRDDLDLVLGFSEGEIRLVLPRQQDVADAALDERGGRAARAGVQHGNVAIQLRDEVPRLGVVAARLTLGVLPRREVVPPRAARRLRVRRNHRRAGLDQIGPVLDALRIALAHQEHDRGGVGRAVLRQPLLPALGDEAALLNGIDVVGERERDDVGVEPVDDGAGLSARAAVRLLDGHGLLRLALPVLHERGVEIGVELTGRIVRRVQQALCGQRRSCRGDDGDRGDRPNETPHHVLSSIKN